MTGLQSVIVLVGRVLLSAIFVLSGGQKLLAWNDTAAGMAKEGMPENLVPLLLAGAAAVELLGGLSVLLGFRARIGGLALFLFLIPTTLIFHDFWAYEGQEKQMQMIHFMKNLAIMGGLGMIVGFGPGGWSLDGQTVRKD